MPVYEYRCERGHLFDVMQRMSDDPLTACTVCESPVQRVFHPVAVHFKGSGFYSTDYGRAASAANSDKSSSDGSSDAGDAAKSEKSDEKSKSDTAGKTKDAAPAPAAAGSD
jgi:putative FmdB family regulatory protein